MNEARLEKLKRLLDGRRQNLEQGLQENSDAQNSNALILIKEIWMSRGSVDKRCTYYRWF